jgi:hypothetical protein
MRACVSVAGKLSVFKVIKSIDGRRGRVRLVVMVW